VLIYVLVVVVVVDVFVVVVFVVQIIFYFTIPHATNVIIVMFAFIIKRVDI